MQEDRDLSEEDLEETSVDDNHELEITMKQMMIQMMKQKIKK